MSGITWPELLHLIGKWAVVIACVILLSLLWSYVVPPLVQLLINSARALRNAASGIGVGLVGWFRDRLDRYIIARRQEPRKPTIVGLSDLRDAVATPMQNVLRDVRVLERDLNRTTALAAKLTPGGPPTGMGGESTSLSAEALSASPWGVIGTLVAAGLIGAFNATLLNIFFGELFGSVRLLPYPLPNLQLSLALGVIFFLLEIFVGHMLGQAHGAADETRTAAFMEGFVPWAGLVVLASVETAAYALLSKQIDLAARLSLDPTGPLYGLATYFLAFLGAGITLILAGLGYSASRQWARYRATATERAIYRAIQDGAKASATHEERIEDVEAALKRLHGAIETLPRDVSARASEAFGTPDQHDTVSLQISGRIDELLPENSASVRTFLRTVVQVFAELGVQLFMCLVTILSVVALVGLYRRLFLQSGALSGESALALASVVSLAVLALGFLLRDARLGGQRGSLVRSVATTATTKSLWAVGALGGLVVLGFASAFAAQEVALLGTSFLLNGAFGFGLTIVLGLLGGVLDLIVVGLMDISLLAWIGLVWGVGRLVHALGFILAFVLDTCRFLAELLAMPGGWLRGVRHNG